MDGNTAQAHVNMCFLCQQRAFPHGPGKTATACRPRGSRPPPSWSWCPTFCSRCSAWAGGPMGCSWPGGWAARGTTAGALAAHRSELGRSEGRRVERSAGTLATTGSGLVAAWSPVTLGTWWVTNSRVCGCLSILMTQTCSRRQTSNRRRTWQEFGTVPSLPVSDPPASLLRTQWWRCRLWPATLLWLPATMTSQWR